MKKLKLTVEELTVESFQTGDDDALNRGTVHGNASDSTCIERRCGCDNDTEWDITCGSCRPLEETCVNTCPTHFNCPTAYYYPGCS
jgi:hypothetical protein